MLVVFAYGKINGQWNWSTFLVFENELDGCTIIVSKNFNVGVHFAYYVGVHLDISWKDFFQTWYDDSYYWTQHFDTSLRDLNLHLRATGVWKRENICASYITLLSVDLDGVMWRLPGLIILMLSSSWLISIQGRE